MLLADPDNAIISQLSFGARTVTSLIVMLNIVLYVGALHLSRKALMDYLDLEDVFKKAMQTSEGAGRVWHGVGLMMVAIAIVIYTAVH